MTRASPSATTVSSTATTNTTPISANISESIVQIHSRFFNVEGEWGVAEVSTSAGSRLRPLFSYGTLQSPELYARITGRSLPIPTQPATLKGFKRRLVKGQVYPGIVADDHADTVTGTLIMPISSYELTLLDRFEGSEYKRITVSVSPHNEQSDSPPQSSLEMIECDVYEFVAGIDKLEVDLDWKLDEFQSIKLI